MSLIIKKQERENSQSLSRRFSKAVRQSGILNRVRDSFFRQRPKSHLAKKKSALRRIETQKEFEKAKKMGKINR